MKLFRYTVVFGFAVALGTIASAHDDNVTHSRITEAALAVIEEAARTDGDERERFAYVELSTNGREYWGKDRRYNEEEDDRLGSRQYLNGGLSVVNGSVAEDAPVSRVGSHFRNAYTGDRSSVAVALGDPFDSGYVGHRYFDQAVEVFGYQEELTRRTVSMVDPDSLSTGMEIVITQTGQPAKQMGFFLLGHSLHHVQDSSSVAHAHNDLHLTLGPVDAVFEYINALSEDGVFDEKDDYEASVIPTLLWDLNDNEKNNTPLRWGTESSDLAEDLPALHVPTPDEPIPADPTEMRPAAVRDFTDVWGVPRQGGDLVLGPGGALVHPVAGLNRSVYNLAVMQGELDVFALMPPYGCAEDAASGEIAETFNRDGNLSCTIEFDFNVIDGHAAWCIDGEDLFLDDGTGTGTSERTEVPGPGCWAQFRITDPTLGIRGAPDRVTRLRGMLWAEIAAKAVEFLLELAEEGWWPTSRDGGPSPAGGGNYFYIEQLMQGFAGGGDFDHRELVRPPGRRQFFDRLYDPIDNPVVGNATDPDSGSFGGNNPLSLAEQYLSRLLPLSVEYSAGYSRLWYDIVNLPPYLKKVQVKQDTQQEPLRYEAEWIDQTRIRDFSFINERLGANVVKQFTYVYERNLTVTTLRHIDPSEPFTLIVEFNEPVNEPDPDPAELGIEIRLNGTVITPDPDGVKRVPPPVQDPWLENREWELAFASIDAAFPGGLPEGEVQLTVQAWDRNFHRNNDDGAREYGAMLDQQPGTPARRQRIRPDEERADRIDNEPNVSAPWGASAWIDYPWHDADSVDVNFPEMENGDFEYDMDGPGDNTHVLLFDDTPPEASFEVLTP